MEFCVKGKIHGKARPRFTKRGKPYTPQTTKDYEELIQVEFQRQCGTLNYFPTGVPVGVTIIAVIAPPKATSQTRWQKMLSFLEFPTKKPDIDNIEKIVLDALNGLAYADDKQVVAVRKIKIYGKTDKIIVDINGVEKITISEKYKPYLEE